MLAPQNVVPGSPADKAGLKPLTDIICGTQDATFRSSVHLCGVMVMLLAHSNVAAHWPGSTGVEQLTEYVQRNRRPTFFVYNEPADTVREVALDLSSHWGDGRSGLGMQQRVAVLVLVLFSCLASPGSGLRHMFQVPLLRMASITNCECRWRGRPMVSPVVL